MNCRSNEEPVGNRSEGIIINLGVLLPLNDVKLAQDPCFSIKHLLLSAKSAIRAARPFFPTPAVSKIIVRFEDSNCSDTTGPLKAMDLFRESHVHAFFGPCCKYVLSPVARYSTVWNTPVISPGGLTPVFSNKKMFPQLTRIIAPYDKLAEFIVSILEYYDWTYYSLLWHDHHTHPHLGKSECGMMRDALVKITRTNSWIAEPYKDSFDELHNLNYYNWGEIFDGIRNSSRSKFFSYRSIQIRYATFVQVCTTGLWYDECALQ